jgi:hypothetical protein
MNGIASDANGSGRCAQSCRGVGLNRLLPKTPPAEQKPAAVACELPQALSDSEDLEFDQAQQFWSAMVELPPSEMPLRLDDVLRGYGRKLVTAGIGKAAYRGGA